jgi:hypothetical protein
MPVHSLEEQALCAIFRPMVRKCIWEYTAFLNWKAKYDLYRFSKKYHGPSVYFPKEYFCSFCNRTHGTTTRQCRRQN